MGELFRFGDVTGDESVGILVSGEDEAG